MPFWRRRRKEPADLEPTQPVEPVAPEANATEAAAPEPPQVEIDPDAVAPGWEPDPADFEDSGDVAVEVPSPPIATPDRPDAVAPPAEPAEPVAPAEPAAPAYAPFDPTAFLAVAPAHTLDEGLERTRTGFMSQLRGYLGGDDPHGDRCRPRLRAESPTLLCLCLQIDRGPAATRRDGVL